MNTTLGEGRSREGGGSRAAQYDVITKTRDCPPVTNTIFERMLCSPAPDGLFECTESNNVNWRRGGGRGGNSPPTIPMSTTRTCPYVSKTPSPPFSFSIRAAFPRCLTMLSRAVTIHTYRVLYVFIYTWIYDGRDSRYKTVTV